MILNFDFNSSAPIYQQLRNQIVVGIAEGKLKPGEQLPTIRALAEESGINMMTVSKAYQILKQEGYITTDRRSGAKVAVSGRNEIPAATLEQLRLHLSELRLAGLTKEEILQICETLYEEDGNK
ncbi:MAG: GntR family transcriptional regulator [Erysipelotrichaceae bacterium]|nr:GntR family transcriptional regulator [Erysipelotrichaceae bacterium]